MTFNIQHGRDYIKRCIDLNLMAQTISKCQPDIIGLNEVFGADRENPNQAEEIAKIIGYYYYFGQAIIFKGRPYGNAILSKYPFKSVEAIMIEDPIPETDEYYESRCIIKAEIAHPNLTVLVSHFGLAKSEQINAVNTVQTLINAIKTPIVLMGDFNLEPNDEKLKPLYQLLQDTNNDGAPTFPSINPLKKIDYIFCSKEIKIKDATIPNLVASDHLPHTALLEINE